MHFTKFPYPQNFAYARRHAAGRVAWKGGAAEARLEDLGGDVFRFQVGRRAVGPNLSAPDTRAFRREASTSRVGLTADARLRWTDARGEVVLESLPGMGIGFSGQAFILNFLAPPEVRYYGLGEKNGGFERSGRRTRFWNTDLFGDFHRAPCERNEADPLYKAIPYLVVASGGRYAGILLDNPCDTFAFTLGSTAEASAFGAPGAGGRQYFSLGGEHGACAAFLILGPTLKDLTRKLMRLVGPSPLPPLWSIGNQQCRWGYKDERDLLDLERSFRRHRIPVDGLWLDIDYMRGFRVFTVDKKNFKDFRATVGALRKRGLRVVPILDPGVKREKGYEVYDDGARRGVYCRNAAGGEFVGTVWPGDTVFPDFSLASARAWWADRTARFAADGVEGAWLDMNDPSVGCVDPEGMLFGRGRFPHHTFHNQYALGMARASFDGFRRARPDTRPFLLARSASSGSGRWTAVWMGDNVSNYHWLKGTIPMSLNLSLSGLPHNGADVGGFMGDTEPRLFIRWTKAAFLMPFFRNHTCQDTRRQEPWTLGKDALAVSQRYIRLRYRFLPHLYQLFRRQESVGDPVMRPVIYEFPATPAQDFSRLDDAFLVGPSLLHCPHVEDSPRRTAMLPPGRWLDFSSGAWTRGGRTLVLRESRDTTGLWGREGHVLFLRPGACEKAATDLLDVEAHILLACGSRLVVEDDYAADDGESYGYRRGETSALRLRASATGATLRLEVLTTSGALGPVRLRPVLHDRFTRLVVARDGEEREVALEPRTQAFTGRPLRLLQAAERV